MKRSYATHKMRTYGSYKTTYPKEGRSERHHFKISASNPMFLPYTINTRNNTAGQYCLATEIPMNCLYEPLVSSPTTSVSRSFAGGSSTSNTHYMPQVGMLWNTEEFVRVSKYYYRAMCTGCRLTIETKTTPNAIVATDTSVTPVVDPAYNGPANLTMFMFPCPSYMVNDINFSGNQGHARVQPGYREVQLDRGGNTSSASSNKTSTSLSCFASPPKLNGDLYPGGGSNWMMPLNVDGTLSTTRPTNIPYFVYGFSFYQQGFPAVEDVLDWSIEVKVHFTWYFTANQRRVYPDTESYLGGSSLLSSIRPSGLPEHYDYYATLNGIGGCNNNNNLKELMLEQKKQEQQEEDGKSISTELKGMSLGEDYEDLKEEEELVAALDLIRAKRAKISASSLAKDVSSSSTTVSALRRTDSKLISSSLLSSKLS